MDLAEAIRGRRSIRKYLRKPVADDTVRQVLETGLEAPSAGNLQGRHFYAVKDQQLKKALAKAALDQDFISEAAVVMVVCADMRIQAEYGARGRDLYSIMDCAASIQNMMLRAYSLGLGTCWVGAFDEYKISQLLQIPARFRPVAIIPLGYPGEQPETPSRVSLESACDFR